MTVLEDAVRIASQGLDRRLRAERVVQFYVRRRGTKLAGQHPGWTVDQLSGALVSERAIVSTYVRERTAHLIGGTDMITPPHLDLTVMAKIRSSGTLADSMVEAALGPAYEQNRRDWIAQIVWRAVAVHDELLWQQPMPPRRLETAALDEIVDRRLRVVERMTCNVNSGGILNRTRDRTWSVAGPDGPWNDGMLVRVFEYAFLPERPFRAHLAGMTDWRSAGEGMITYDPPGRPGVEVPPRSASSWGLFRDGDADVVWVRFLRNSSVAPAEAIQRLFALGHTNFLQRNWFLCDYVGSALGVEALWFGRARRDGNSTAFDAVMRRPGPNGNGYVVFGPLIGPPTVGLLMSDSADAEFFENVEIDVDELQVGDFVLFWNNVIYDLVARGDWRNEYSYVMGVDADPQTGATRRTGTNLQVELAGHGVHTRSYSAMALELSKTLQEPLKQARKQVTDALAVDPTRSRVGSYVKWSPYEDFDAPGAWWILVGEATWKRRWGYPTVAAAVDGVPRTVANDPAAGAGYRAPPDTSAIYFPLWEPKVSRLSRLLRGGGDSWRAYLHRRKTDPTYRPPTGLAELAVDGQLTPGLFYNGSSATVPVIRPRVRR